MHSGVINLHIMFIFQDFGVFDTFVLCCPHLSLLTHAISASFYYDLMFAAKYSSVVDQENWDTTSLSSFDPT